MTVAPWPLQHRSGALGSSQELRALDRGKGWCTGGRPHSGPSHSLTLSEGVAERSFLGNRTPEAPGLCPTSAVGPMSGPSRVVRFSAAPGKFLVPPLLTGPCRSPGWGAGCIQGCCGSLCSPRSRPVPGVKRMGGPCSAAGTARDFHLGHSQQGLQGEETSSEVPSRKPGRLLGLREPT